MRLSQLPHPRPGLWRWRSDSSGVRDICLSGQVLSVLEPKPGCPVTRQVRRGDGAYVVVARCRSGPVRTSWAVARGDFGSDFRVEIGLGDLHDHAEARYLGPCPSGRKPIDLP